LLLHATRQLLQWFVDPFFGDAETTQDRKRLHTSDVRRHAVETTGVHEVLHGRELLEERGLDGYAVDQPFHLALVRLDVEPEHAHHSGVRDEQRREDADERRLSRAVRTEQGVDLAAGDPQRDTIHRTPQHLVGAERFDDPGGHEGIAVEGHGRDLRAGPCRDVDGHLTLPEL